MKKLHIFLALAAVGLVVLGAACGKKDTNQNTNTGVVVNTSENENTNPGSLDNENENRNANTSGNVNSNRNTNSSESSDDEKETVTSQGTLSIAKPEKGEAVESPIEVEGKAAGSSVTVSIMNTSGKEVLSVPVTVRNGSFRVNLSYEFVNTTAGTVQVTDASGNKVSVAVSFKVESGSNATSLANTNSSEDDMNTNSSTDY